MSEINMTLIKEEGLKRKQDLRDTSVLPKGVRYLTTAEQRTVVSMIMYDLMEAGFLNSKGIEFLNRNPKELPDDFISFVDLNYYIEDFFSGTITKLAKPFENNISAQSPTLNSNIQFSEG